MGLKYPTTSKKLLDRIATGDEISWDEFYERYCGIVRKLAMFNGLKAAEADDICQQVMLQFFKQSKTFKFDPDIARSGEDAESRSSDGRRSSTTTARRDLAAFSTTSRN